jgi:hypothetical protein
MQGLFCWNSARIQHAVSVDGDPRRRDTQDLSWSTEVALPWEDFLTAPHLPPRPGDVWRANLYRIDRYRSQRELGQPELGQPELGQQASGQQELYAWSPTYCGTFHRPRHFGEIVFVK